MLLCSFCQCCGFWGPGEVLAGLNTQKLGAAHSHHSSTLNGQWRILCVASLEVDNNLFGLADIHQVVVVVLAPRSQMVNLLAVVSLIPLGDDPHQKFYHLQLHKVFLAVGWCAVFCLQGEEQRTEHTTSWGPCAQSNATQGVVANKYGSYTYKKHSIWCASLQLRK